MSSSGPIQLPQAQAKSTSQALPQQKPLSLPTQSKGVDSTSSNGSKEDGKPDVKDTPIRAAVHYGTDSVEHAWHSSNFTVRPLPNQWTS